jgi:cysteine sulfinate desulfinase/cysteine desulfurase-like protein
MTSQVSVAFARHEDFHAEAVAAQAVRVVRFSAGWETTETDWDALVKGVAKVHAEMQPH